MAKPRFTVDGLPLPENLYSDNKGRPDYWRYRREDGTYKHFQSTYDQACAVAARANELRGTAASRAATASSIEFWRIEYVKWAEEQDPRKQHKRAWKCRVQEMARFAQDFNHIRINKLKLDDLTRWWEGMTYDMQHNRRAAFSKWFQWMIAKSIISFNPFTSNDESPRLLDKAKPAKARLPLDIKTFWTIYQQAGEIGYTHVQTAMAISIVTTMRAGDIVSLTFKDHVVDSTLKKTINKSVGQRGATGASHLSWSLNKHILLRRIINRARENSIKNMNCPNIVSFKSRIHKESKTKAHRSSVTVNRLSKHFAVVRDATGLFKNLPSGRTPPTFHEVRGLSIKQAKDSGVELSKISELAAHTDERVTEGYIADHAPTFLDMEIVFDEKMVGGNFD